MYGTRRDAQAELNQLVAQYQGRLTEVTAEAGAVEGRVVRWGPNTTINDAIEGWKLNGWSDLSPTTQRRYQGMWDLQVRNGIDRRRLADLTPWDLERFFRELKAQGLSKDSVRQVRAMLHRGLPTRSQVEQRCPSESGGRHRAAGVELCRAVARGALPRRP